MSAAADLAALAFAWGAGQRSARQHRVLGRDPTLAAVTQPTWDSLLDRGMGKPVQPTAAELVPLLEEPRTGDDAKDVTERLVIIEQDPLYASYVAWGRGLAEAKKKG